MVIAFSEGQSGTIKSMVERISNTAAPEHRDETVTWRLVVQSLIALITMVTCLVLWQPVNKN